MQQDTVCCEACGIYFAKVGGARDPHRSTVILQMQPHESRRFGFGALILTALVSAGAVLYLVGRKPEPQMVLSSVKLAVPVDTGVQPTHHDADVGSAPIPTGLAAQLARVMPARNPIEAARNATVFIKTSWGLGSGFIVDAACHVVTNRHVVETDGARVASNLSSEPALKAKISVEQDRLRVAIARAQLVHAALKNVPGKQLERVQLETKIADMSRKLASLPQDVSRKIATTVEDSGRSGFTVQLIDGTEYEGLHAVNAERLDLALFKLPEDNCPYIARGQPGRLQVGEHLYTIGNPAGMAYSVTSGIYSGPRMIEQQQYLQTDAPINGGNSGGPLITEAGEVVGINTMTLRGTQGVGFALPIDAIYETFGDLR